MLKTEELEGLEHEIKFVLPARRQVPASLLLRALCRPDFHHPANTVLSLYFDTGALDLLRDKIDGNRQKVKVRLRWYEDDTQHSKDSGSFAELKFRVGSRRKKIRVPTELSAEWLGQVSLDDPGLSGVPELLPTSPDRFRGRLLPYLVVRYQRRRFVDPLSRTRISLDTDILVQRVNPRLLPRRRALPLAPAVLEFKNYRGDIPTHLRSVLSLGSRMSSFSKYASCFATAISDEQAMG